MTSVKPSTEYGKRVYVLSYVLYATQITLFTGFIATCQIADSEL